MTDNQFNFNRVVDLYREGKVLEWCEYLYENIWVFIDSCKTIHIYPSCRDDVMSEAILEGHESILRSLDREYWQIYNYVKTRIVWRIKNFYKKDYRHSVNFHWVSVDDIWDIPVEFKSYFNDEIVLRFVIEWILMLSETDRQIIYLRIFNFPWKTWKEIAAISWIKDRTLSSRYVKAVNKIRDHLEFNWIKHEDLF